jgi:hypothetical protein
VRSATAAVNSIPVIAALTLQEALLHSLDQTLLLVDRRDKTLVHGSWAPGRQRIVHLGLLPSPLRRERSVLEQELLRLGPQGGQLGF